MMKRIITVTLIIIGLAACGSGKADDHNAGKCQNAISRLPTWLSDDILSRAGAQADVNLGLYLAAEACQPWIATGDAQAAQCLDGIMDLRHSIEMLSLSDVNLKTAADYAETASYHFDQCQY